jgi:hypothetical protein
MSKFVETEVKTTILETMDAFGPNLSFVSIVPMTYVSGVEVVIGARYADRNSYCFSKSGLKELINILKEVHDAME